MAEASGGKEDTKKVKRVGAADGKVGGGPTILAAEAFTHGGVRKAKFEPKVPMRRQKKPIEVKREFGVGGEGELPSEIMKLVKQSQEDSMNARSGRRADIKAPVRVAFGFGSAMAGRATTGFHSGGGGSRVDKKALVDNLPGSLEDSMVLDEKHGKLKKAAVEPWDYSKYYPTTLPLSEPYSIENSEEENYGESTIRDFDENSVPSAEELGLMMENDEDRLLFFQIPSSLPLSKEVGVNSDGGRESNSSSRSNSKESVVTLNKLPEGKMGKLLVYNSGVVKLKLGDIILEALPGSKCVFAQELAAINPTTKHCCFLGNVGEHVVLVPDVDHLLQNNDYG